MEPRSHSSRVAPGSSCRSTVLRGTRASRSCPTPRCAEERFAPASREGALELAREDRVVRLDWVDRADAGDEYDFGAIDDDVELAATIDRWSPPASSGPGVAELEVVHVLELPARSPTTDRRARRDTVRHEVSYARARE